MDTFKLMCEAHRSFGRGCEAEFSPPKYTFTNDPLQENDHGWFDTATFITSTSGTQPGTLIRLTRLLHEWVCDLPSEFTNNMTVSFAVTDQSVADQCRITVTFAYRKKS